LRIKAPLENCRKGLNVRILLLKTTSLSLLLACTVISFAQTANFTASNTSGCSPVVINFQNQSTGNPTSYFWDFGNGATSTLVNPSTTYFKPGKYTVKLTATNARGSNTITKTQYIVVWGKPNINFTVNDSTACFPHRAQFTDLTTASSETKNTDWLWDFGDGSQSTDQNPLHVFTASGNYTVTLKVTNDKGCYSAFTKTAYIQIAGGVQSSFTNTQPTVCRPPFDISFNNTSTGPNTLTWFWNFGDGQTSTAKNPLHTYTTPGNYTITLSTTSSGGCSDTLVKDTVVKIQNITTSFTGPDSICINADAFFINTSSPNPVSTLWEFGNGATASTLDGVQQYATPNTYTVTLYNTYAYCKDSASKTIKTVPRPKALFTSDTRLKCEPSLTVNFKDQSTNAVSWQWFFGDNTTSTEQNPSHTYTQYGNYNVWLVVTNASGCTDTLKIEPYVKIQRPKILINPLPAKGCIPFDVTLTPIITTLDAVTSYEWDFGDGSPLSNAVAPPHVYTEQGTYQVKLTITTSTGCTETAVVNEGVKVGRHMAVNFDATPKPACALSDVVFTNLTDTIADQWLWVFGDGGSSTVKDPIYKFSDTGYMNVKLYATNHGCLDSSIQNQFIRIKPPIAKFGFKSDCKSLARLDFNFSDSSIVDPTLGNLTWSWNFGDGSPIVNAQNTPHTFPGYATYNVTLTVTNGTCSNSITKPVRVFKESVDFTVNPDAICWGQTVILKSQVDNPDHFADYSWKSSNGGFASGPTAGFTYYLPGNFIDSLFTTDINGCKDTASHPVRVNGPLALFNAINPTGCKGLETTFIDATKNDGVNNIVSWKWDFGDKTAADFSPGPVKHTYPNLGNYDVKLVVKDAFGCVDSITKASFVITSNPKAAFIADSVSCPTAKVFFTNRSNALNYTSVWDFGDSTGSNLNSTFHVYADTGKYTIKLKITDQYGCSDSLIKTDHIKLDRPRASFTLNDSISSCIPFEVRFTNNSHYFTNVNWDLGGGISNLLDPVQFYNKPGDYPIRLIVTSPGYCYDTAYGLVKVYDTIGSRINYAPLDGCKPFPVDMNAFSKGPMTYTWDFGDGVLQNTNDTAKVNHIYNAFGKFIPKVIMTDPAGCIIPVTGIDTVHIKGATVKFGADLKLLCDSGVIHFTDSTLYNDSLSTYNWDFGDGNISHVQHPVHYYTQPGNYSVLLNVQTVSACVDTFRLKDTIRVVESPLISIGGDSVICVNDFIEHLGVFERTDTSVVKWSWVFPNGNKSGIQFPEKQQYGKAGNFMVSTIAVNSSGCKDTATKPIVVHPLPVVNMPSTITMQAGFPVTIPATYSSNVVNYAWQPATTLDCGDCASPVASPKFNTTYTVSFVDSNGCRNTGQVQVIVICKNANVFVPNTFSPNNDGVNDVFYVRGKGLDRVKSLRIFNRWGEVVYESMNFPVNNPVYGWDGKYKGNKPVADVYVYQIEVFCENSEIIRFEGNVALIQ
jgi:gliding motility-associated-like protein